MGYVAFDFHNLNDIKNNYGCFLLLVRLFGNRKQKLLVNRIIKKRSEYFIKEFGIENELPNWAKNT